MLHRYPQVIARGAGHGVWLFTASSGQICVPMTGFFPGGKSNYTQQKVLWNSISDSAVVAFQHILIWAHQRQHVISCNQLCLGVVQVGCGMTLHYVWDQTQAIRSWYYSGPSCCNVTQHSALHLSLFYIKQYITTLQWATTHTHGASVCRILLISFVFPQIASVIWGQCVLFSSFFLCLAMYSSRGLSCNRGSLTRLSFSPSLQADKRWQR